MNWNGCCVEMKTHPRTVQRSRSAEFYLRTTVRHRGIMGSHKRKGTLALFKTAGTASFSSYFKFKELNRSTFYGRNVTTFPEWRRLATSCVDWQIIYKQVIMISWWNVLIPCDEIIKKKQQPGVLFWLLSSRSLTRHVRFKKTHTTLTLTAVYWVYLKLGCLDGIMNICDLWLQQPCRKTVTRRFEGENQTVTHITIWTAPILPERFNKQWQKGRTYISRY